MAKPGPKKGSVRLTEEHRDKIRNSKILQRLIGHAEGTEEMNATQVTAALGLMRKVMPDISEQTLKGDEDAPLFAPERIVLVDGGK